MKTVKKILYNFILLFMLYNFTGCGNQSNFEPSVSIKSNYIIDVNRSRNIIKKELGTHYINAKVSDDKKNIFVQTINDNDQYSLLNYNITEKTPVLENILIEYSAYQIYNIYPLPKNKILFSFVTDEEYETVLIYDYKTNKRIRKFVLEYSFLIPLHNITLSPDKKNFSIDIYTFHQYTPLKHTINISSIYQDFNKNTLYRNDNEQIVVDPANRLVWEDTKNNLNKRYTLQEAIRYCESLPKYNWRLPTIHEIELLIQQQKPFTAPFLHIADNIFTYFWLQPLQKTDKISWKFDPVSYQFYYWDDFFATEDLTGFTRCVADY